MKLYSALLLTTSILLAAGCAEENVEPVGTIDSVTTVAMQGNWKVNYFWDNAAGHDEAGHYNGFMISFQTGQHVFAVNGSTSYAGNWNVTDSNLSSNKLNELRFSIIFSSPTEFVALSKEWTIVSFTESRLHLSFENQNKTIDRLILVR